MSDLVQIVVAIFSVHLYHSTVTLRGKKLSLAFTYPSHSFIYTYVLAHACCTHDPPLLKIKNINISNKSLVNIMARLGQTGLDSRRRQIVYLTHHAEKGHSPYIRGPFLRK